MANPSRASFLLLSLRAPCAPLHVGETLINPLSYPSVYPSLKSSMAQPYTAEPLDIRIKSQQRTLDEHILRVCESFQIPVVIPTTNYLDTNIGSQHATVRVYMPGRDDGHSMVYSLVEADGFYLSYDKVTWQLIDTWG